MSCRGWGVFLLQYLTSQLFCNVLNRRWQSEVCVVSWIWLKKSGILLYYCTIVPTWHCITVDLIRVKIISIISWLKECCYHVYVHLQKYICIYKSCCSQWSLCKYCHYCILFMCTDGIWCLFKCFMVFWMVMFHSPLLVYLHWTLHWMGEHDKVDSSLFVGWNIYIYIYIYVADSVVFKHVFVKHFVLFQWN